MRILLYAAFAVLSLAVSLVVGLSGAKALRQALYEPEGVDRVAVAQTGPATDHHWSMMDCAFGLEHHSVLYDLGDSLSTPLQKWRHVARDGAMKTAWLSSRSDCAAGGALEFSSFSNRMGEDWSDRLLDSDYDLSGLVLVSGWARDEKTWRAHARPKRLKLWIDERPVAEIALEDTLATQWAGFRKRRIPKDARVRVEILEVYCGEDASLPVAISEIDLTSSLPFPLPHKQ